MSLTRGGGPLATQGPRAVGYGVDGPRHRPSIEKNAPYDCSVGGRGISVTAAAA